MKWLNLNTLQGVLRTVLAFVGGLMVAKGKVSQEQVNSIIGSITDPQFMGTLIAIITGVWSVIHKQQLAPTITIPTPTK